MSDTNPPAAAVNKLTADGNPVIDLNRFSQSELYALSRVSKSSPSSSNDVVIPKIDRSISIESTGSNNLIDPPLHHAPPAHSSSAASSYRETGNAANPDPENAENAQIIKELKKQLLMPNADLPRISKSSRSFCDGVVIPEIDHSIPNESTGSNKPIIFTPLHLGSPAHSSSAISSHRQTGDAANPDPENAENAQIIKELKKQLPVPNADPDELVDVKADSSDSRASVIATRQKRKRGSPRKSGLAVDLV